MKRTTHLELWKKGNYMKITIVGCGGSGSAIAYLAIKLKNITQICIADSKESRVNKLRLALRKVNKKILITSTVIDATNKQFVEEITRGSKVVINSASPICNIPIMKACISNKSNYIDLASDPFEYPGIDKRTTFSEQLTLHDAFKKNNLVAIPNCGFSPGTTDIIVKNFIEETHVTKINAIIVHFGEKIIADKLIFSWSPYTVLLETLFPPTIYKNKSVSELPNVEGWKEIDFKEDVGKINLRIFSGHPELKTIPNYIALPINYIEIGGGMKLNNLQLPEIILDALSKRISKTTHIEGDLLNELSKEFDSPDNFVENHLAGHIENEYFCGVIHLTGELNNKTITYTYTIREDLKKTLKSFPVSSVGNLVVAFMPVAVIDLILTNKVELTGVITPINLKHPSKILNKIRSFGLNIKVQKG